MGGCSPAAPQRGEEGRAGRREALTGEGLPRRSQSTQRGAPQKAWLRPAVTLGAKGRGWVLVL